MSSRDSERTGLGQRSKARRLEIAQTHLQSHNTYTIQEQRSKSEGRTLPVRDDTLPEGPAPRLRDFSLSTKDHPSCMDASIPLYQWRYRETMLDSIHCSLILTELTRGTWNRFLSLPSSCLCCPMTTKGTSHGPASYCTATTLQQIQGIVTCKLQRSASRILTGAVCL
jgi:hypothetical protein